MHAVDPGRGPAPTDAACAARTPPPLQVQTREECERMLDQMLPPAFDRSLVQPIAQRLMEGQVSR
jgi:hypothetical protein